MEWKKVQNILIVILLCVNLILGFNIFIRYNEMNTAELTSLSAALSIIEPADIGVSERTALELPVYMNAYVIERNDALEQTVAQAILGSDAVRQDYGGEIYVYSGERGAIRFARGGQIDISVTGVSVQTVAKSLTDNGIGECKKISDEKYLQIIDGYDILNGGITISEHESAVTVQGVWFLKASIWAEQTPSRAELLIHAANEVVRLDEEAVVYSIVPGFFSDNRGGKYTQIVPVWTVNTTHGSININVLDKIPA